MKSNSPVAQVTTKRRRFLNPGTQLLVQPCRMTCWVLKTDSTLVEESRRHPEKEIVGNEKR